MAYKPVFTRDPRGNYDYENNFASLIQGSDAYFLEDAANEMQWMQIQNKINENARQFSIGYLSQESIIQNGGNNLIKLKPFNVILGGINFKIDIPNNITFSAATNRTDLVYIEVAFKKIKPTDTSIAKNGTYLKGTAVSAKNISLVDQRLNLQTSGRVQLVYNVGVKTINNDISTTMASINSSFDSKEYEVNDVDMIDEVLPCGTTSEDSTDYVTFYFNDDSTKPTTSLIIPLLTVDRHSGQSAINIDNDVTMILPIARFNGDGSSKKKMEELIKQVEDLNEMIQNLYDIPLIIPDQEAYGFIMGLETESYLGSRNLDGVSVPIRNYEQVNDNIVYQINNLGNNYYGQVGEKWTRMDINNLKVSNTGKKNIIFQVTHFRDDNENIAYMDINSNGITGIQIPLGQLKRGNSAANISSWDLTKCIFCAIPKFTSSQTEIPSIGSWWFTINGTTIKLYNSGAANIPFRIFILLADNENLLLKEVTLSNSTLANDDIIGSHHEFLSSETFDIKNIMLGTPIFTGSTIPNDIDIGEVYLEKGGNNKFMISTTSNGLNVKIKYLIFKTMYKYEEV